MKRDILLGLIFVTACGGSTTTIPDSGSGTDGGPPGEDAQVDVQPGMDASLPDAATGCNAQLVNLTFDGCPAQPTCGGPIADGTYDYTAGCIAGTWAALQKSCPTMQVKSETGTMQGCATFLAGSITQTLATSYSASITVPTSCLYGGTCMQLQAQLAPYFSTATCTSATSIACDCDVSTSTSSTATVTYTAQNGQLSTSTNNKYDYCVQGSSIETEWVSGPNPAAGVYTATKQ